MTKGKVELTVVDQADAEDAEYVVCLRIEGHGLIFPDNEFDFCCRCGEKVQFRPHAPKTPKRLCLQCAPLELEDKHQGSAKTMITPITAAELQKHLVKKN